MKGVLIYLFLLATTSVFAQQNLLPLHSFYKDQLFSNKLEKPLNNGAFFPINESEYALIPTINDSSKQYYTVTDILFKKHLVELKGHNYYITISPIVDMHIGRDFSDSTERNLFQNTRGALIEVDLYDNFSFSTSFFENQSRFTRYETEYYRASGELYPKADKYVTQNAVIPGRGRTKYFKEDGFDYAYAIGSMSYRPIDQVSITAGNNPHFIGEGHRSLLLSDNSYSSPYVQVDWRIHPKLRFSYMRTRLFNLMRRSAFNSVESYYETKGYSVNYLTYMPNNKLNISLFEGIIWNRGDSITSTRVHPMFYNPIPGIAHGILQNQQEISTLFGLNIGAQISPKHRIYGQIALGNLDTKRLGAQIGYRGYDYFGLKDFMLQFEYNYTSDELYKDANPRLNYSHYNLPLAHSKGNGFQEFIVRSNYEYKRVYADLKLVYFLLDNYNFASLLPSDEIQSNFATESYDVLHSTLELGYRFNRKVNLNVFTSLTLRNTTRQNRNNTTFINFGVRTGLFNFYSDF